MHLEGVASCAVIGALVVIIYSDSDPLRSTLQCLHMLAFRGLLLFGAHLVDSRTFRVGASMAVDGMESELRNAQDVRYRRAMHHLAAMTDR